MGMQGEAALCEAPSRLFSGACFSSHNCGTICETEGLANGRCKFFKCICSKDCNIGGGGGGGGGGGVGRGGGGGPPGGDDGPPSDGPPDGSQGPPDGGSPDDTPPPTEGYFMNKDAYLNMNF